MNLPPPSLERVRRAIDAGLADDAWRLASALLAERPADADAAGLAGIAALIAGREATGMALLQSARRRDPGNVQWLWALCRAYAERYDRVKPLPRFDADRRVRWPGWVHAALADVERLAVMRPGDMAALLLAGRFHKAAGNDRRALELGRAALDLDARNVEALKLSGEASNNLHDYETAEAYYVRAVEQAPDDPMARWLLAMRRLAAGDFDTGWQGYETRFEAFPAGTASFPFALARWQGEDLADATLLVHGEQGLGDEIMFASILPEVIERAKAVVVGASPGLAALFVRSFPGARIFPHNRSPESVRRWQAASPPPWTKDRDFDFHAPIGTLARWLRRDAASFPGTAYLRADADKTARFEARLAAAERGERPLRVGVNLAANRDTGLMGLQKHVPPAEFRPLLERFENDIHFVSLQVRGIEPVVDGDGDARFSDFADELVDFDATAALAGCLDTIVTTDTAVAHLAGALGVPALVMLKYNADWRYGDEGERCLWYHSLRLVRQPRPGDWPAVIERVGDLLAARVGEAATPSDASSAESAPPSPPAPATRRDP